MSIALYVNRFFSIMAVLSVRKGTLFSYLFDNSHSNTWKVTSHCGFNLISLRLSNVVHFFMNLLVILFEKCTYMFLTKLKLCCFLPVESLKVFIYLGYELLIRCKVCKYLTVGCLFALLIVSFVIQSF